MLKENNFLQSQIYKKWFSKLFYDFLTVNYISRYEFNDDNSSIMWNIS